MGDRAAKNTNHMINRLSDMYVGMNHGCGSKKMGVNYDRVFRSRNPSPENPSTQASITDALFGRGPLGLEINWIVPPIIASVIEGGAAHKAGLQADSVILRINGADASAPRPQLEWEEMFQDRPLRLEVDLCPNTLSNILALPVPAACDVIRHRGVAIIPASLHPDKCSELLAFAFEERERCMTEVEADPSVISDKFSDVQTPRAGKDLPTTRWDMRLPCVPLVDSCLRALLSELLGSTFEALTGPDAELWELGVLVSEPGAAPQPVHFDAPDRGLITAFIALQDVRPEMGPTVFLPGTNTHVAHRMCESDPVGFIRHSEKFAPLLNAGDAVIYDSQIFHSGTENESTESRVLMYITFRPSAMDPQRLGIEQHSIRADLMGRYRLKDFRGI